MKALLRKAIDVRPGESQRVLVMAIYVFVIIASYNILKPMTRSLFVTNLGPAQLPLLYMLLAAVVSLVIVAYLRISANLNVSRLINSTSLFLIGNLFVFWWLLNDGWDMPWLYYALFIWASIYGILTSTQFWLLANYLFDAREAKRLFPVLTACAILGGILGGYLTRLCVSVLGGTHNLAFLCIGLLATTVLLVNSAWRLREKSLERSRSSRTPKEAGQTSSIIQEVSQLIRNSRHLGFILSIVAITYTVVQIADFQFIAFANETMSDVDTLTGFLGFWLSNLSVLALVFQVFFSGYIIRRFGVGATILFLPVTLLLSSVWVFFAYGLVSILAMKVSDGAFRHSINKVGSELLFLPIATDVKKKTKAFVDMFADRFARGFAGLLLLIFYTWLGLSVAQIGLLSIALVGVWLVLSIKTYREYVNSFRLALADRRIDADSLSFSIKDLNIINSLIVSLASTNERQVIYALKMLRSVQGVELTPPLRPLLHPRYSAEVRLHALSLLYDHGDSSLLPDIQNLLYDKHEAIQREAVRFSTKFSQAPVREMFSNWLQDQNSGLRGAALFQLAENREIAEELLSRDLIQSFFDEGSQGRGLVADAIAILLDENYYPFLKKLLDDSDHSVKTRAIISAGKTGAEEFIPLLVPHLSDREFRNTAREALVSYGDSVVEYLADYLQDDTPAECRAGIMRVFGLVGTQRSVEILLENLTEKNEYVRYQMIKALNKLRARFSYLNFDDRVDKALLDELKEYFQIQATLLQTNGTKDHNGELNHSNLLSRALQERLDEHLERIFRLLGLRYPPRDIYNAYAAASSSNRALRANAIEFLDNILNSNYKELLLLVVEDLPVEQALRQANGFFKVEVSSRKAGFNYLLASGDPWLTACVLYEIGKQGLANEFQAEIREAQSAGNNLVRETANLVTQRFA